MIRNIFLIKSGGHICLKCYCCKIPAWIIVSETQNYADLIWIKKCIILYNINITFFHLIKRWTVKPLHFLTMWGIQLIRQTFATKTDIIRQFNKHPTIYVFIPRVFNAVNDWIVHFVALRSQYVEKRETYLLRHMIICGFQATVEFHVAITVRSEKNGLLRQGLLW